MNTLIVYASLHGCTKKCALQLSKHLIGKTNLHNLKDAINIDLSKYSNIIIGGSMIIISILLFFAQTNMR